MCDAFQVFSLMGPAILSSLSKLCYLIRQGSLYFTFRRAVGVFRGLVGAPDTPKWNSVLFGGEKCVK